MCICIIYIYINRNIYIRRYVKYNIIYIYMCIISASAFHDDLHLPFRSAFWFLSKKIDQAHSFAARQPHLHIEVMFG